MNKKNEIQPDQRTIDDILNLFKSGKLNNAKIKIRVEGGDPPEALLKLNDTLVKVLP